MLKPISSQEYATPPGGRIGMVLDAALAWWQERYNVLMVKITTSGRPSGTLPNCIVLWQAIRLTLPRS